MFGDTGDRFIRFGGGDISKMLAHTSTEVYSCLTNVFGIYTAAACLKVDTFLVEFARTGFVGAAEDVSEFWTRF